MKKTKFWVLLIVVLLAVSVAAAILLTGQARSGTAKVWKDGVLLRTIELSAVDEPYSFSVIDAEDGGNIVEVERGRIRVSAADCPDQVCVHQGWISTSASPVVCLPHGLVIEIVGGEGPDAMTQ